MKRRTDDEVNEEISEGALSPTIASKKMRNDLRVDFSYELTGRGWAEATIAERDQRATIPVSYLTVDALGDLLAAVTAAMGALGEERFRR